MDANTYDIVARLVTELGPKGLRRLRLTQAGDLEIELAPPVVVMGAPENAGSGEVDDEASAMEASPTADPLEDPATFGGRKPPTYMERRAAARAREQGEDESLAEGEDA